MPQRHAARVSLAGPSLTVREREMITLIVQGLSNQDIATHTRLSINSIKSCIRSAYQKIGAERREHAIRWGREHGFDPASPQSPGRT